MTNYPASIDTNATLPLVADNLTPVQGDTVNRLRNAIIALEAELGVKPSGIYTTVRARLDALELAINGLVVNGLNGDVTGGLATTKVAGLGGRPFSDQAPFVNQVISWNGIAWIPQTLTNIVLNVLPTSVLLPTEIQFLSGDGYSNSSSPFRVGARAVDMSLYPHSWPDGRTRTMMFTADLEVTNATTDGYVQLKDITHNVVIINSLLHTKSLSSVELSAEITSGTTDGYMREDCCNVIVYEVQVYLTGGGVSDQVICRNARIDVTYSAPILVSALVPLALPTDINIVCGTELNGFTTPAGIGGRNLDMSKFPLALPDNRLRTVKFYADVEVSAPGVDGYIQLFDTTHNVLVTNTQFHFTSTIATEVISIPLAVGTSSGNIRNDAITRYEARIWKVSGSPADRVICNNARIQITYA